MSMAQDLTRLEQEIARISGIKTARVVGVEEPLEIHVVAGSRRPPKQIVRDVQSLAAARFGLAIDHRIVSVVRLEEDGPVNGVSPDGRPPSKAGGAEVAQRPAIERVVLTSGSDTARIDVALRWPSGAITEGRSLAGPSREARARAAVDAALQAIEHHVAPRPASVDVEYVAIERLGDDDSVLLRGTWTENDAGVPVVGAAVIVDDAATAAVRALLHALNRKLS
jgi:hypothetical protein